VGDGVENRLDIGGRARDDPQDLRRRRLLIERAAIDTVLAKDPTLLPTAIRRGLKNEEYARGFVELVARVCKEIGADAVHDTRPVIFNFHTNLNPMALAGPQSPMRRIIDGESSRGVGAPGLPLKLKDADGRQRIGDR
jgi:hypothetical protein